MNNSKHKAKRLSVALLIAVLAVSTSFASVMTGCGNKDESSSTAATVTSTASAAENTTVANDKSESEVTSESSNSQSSGSESKRYTSTDVLILHHSIDLQNLIVFWHQKENALIIAKLKSVSLSSTE